ncbi:MAG: putative N-acetylmannosamine-6-phosphate 2-epimerase [Erysipelotrichaceae bacterium]|nr:putative N-acetylmannosamine-6-phosphate 2-epimerase [Erysipelotrichaceae bacterium]MDD3924082.1 putative N-acetylmannosamine-6-phosphate 2-epimerase [Erysipelotrichaceae bacterium]MDD4643129.1 putative N-acetylmannosamine-6-phosphate 2-epimerase [Erysipelotrichaceae bacterium]
MNTIVKKLLGKIIISCQAYEDTPLYGSQYMKVMAQSALLGNASGIRACWPQDIRAIRELGDFPIIGINKIMDHNKDPKDYIFITPTLESATAVIEAGCDIVALDCTLRPFRDKKALYDLLKSIKDKHPSIALMADIRSLEEGIFAAETGLVDIVATTLSSSAMEEPKADDELVSELKKRISVPINAEGAIWDLNDLQRVIDAGADMVTIGTAVTRPHLVTERFVEFNKKLRG